MRLEGKKIILGITGSIAAYKAAMLLRLLVKEGAEVHAGKNVKFLFTDAQNKKYRRVPGIFSR